MNFYKKNPDPVVRVLFGSPIGETFAGLLINAIREPEVNIFKVGPDGEAPKVGANETTICTDADSAIRATLHGAKLCVFWTNPYEEIEVQKIPLSMKKEKILRLHNSITRSKKIIAATESCRASLQMHHSQFVHLLPLPATYYEQAEDINWTNVCIVADSDVHYNKSGVARMFSEHNPTIIIESNARWPDDPIVKPTALYGPDPLLKLRSRIIIYIGEESCTATPFRIIDAPHMNSVVIHINLADGPQSAGRGLPSDCIGSFKIGSSSDPEISHINLFIKSLLADHLLFSSVLSAQRRYLAAINLYYPDFVSGVIHK